MPCVFCQFFDNEPLSLIPLRGLKLLAYLSRVKGYGKLNRGQLVERLQNPPDDEHEVKEALIPCPPGLSTSSGPSDLPAPMDFREHMKQLLEAQELYRKEAEKIKISRKQQDKSGKTPRNDAPQ